MHRPSPSSSEYSVAIIGAGLSGLTAGQALAEAGHAVAVFDKGRGPGGRMSTRRQAETTFDHGAQYFTVRDERFRRRVASWTEAGIVQRWDGRIGVAEGGAVTPKGDGPERYVGVPRMSAVPRHLADGLDVRCRVRVEAAEPSGARWSLVADDGADLGTFDAVLVTVPPPQAAPLLAAAPDLARRAASVTMEPTWAAMATFDAPLPVEADGLFVHDAPLSWAARNSSKPGRPALESWVFHGAPAWTETHIEDEPDAVVEALLSGFFAATGLRPVAPTFAQAHRWRYAQADEPLEDGCLWDEAQRLGACGDWCHGSRVEGAFLSGLAGAEAVARSLAPSSAATE
ncbi:MAG: FAD-dependent oxidoreductase [Bacteroidota bacterium]